MSDLGTHGQIWVDVVTNDDVADNHILDRQNAGWTLLARAKANEFEHNTVTALDSVTGCDQPIFSPNTVLVFGK